MPRRKGPVVDTQGEPGGDGLSNVRAVERAIAVLRSFSADTPTMSVLELQRRVGLSRPTLYRLLQTLTTSGMITSEGDPQRFRLSSGVMQLAHTWLSGLNIIDVARPLVDELRNETDETAALFLLRGNERLCVLEQESRHVLSIARGVGETGSISKGASGKAVLAFMDERQRASSLPAMTNSARSDLERVLAAVRKSGYAVSRGEVFVGAVAVAAPVFDYTGKVIGSMGVFGPSARVPETTVPDFARLVKEAAASLSSLLGYQAMRAPDLEPKPRSTRTSKTASE